MYVFDDMLRNQAQSFYIAAHPVQIWFHSMQKSILNNLSSANEICPSQGSPSTAWCRNSFWHWKFNLSQRVNCCMQLRLKNSCTTKEPLVFKNPLYPSRWQAPGMPDCFSWKPGGFSHFWYIYQKVWFLLARPPEFGPLFVGRLGNSLYCFNLGPLTPVYKGSTTLTTETPGYCSAMLCYVAWQCFNIQNTFVQPLASWVEMI